MDRRIFLFGGVAGLLSASSRSTISATPFRDDPFLKDMKKGKLSVGHRIPGGNLQYDFDVIGWEMNIEEDDHTLFDFVVTNSGPKEVRIAHCQPFTTGPWQIIERLSAVGVTTKEVKHSWRCCNDSNFFFIEMNNGGTWTPINADNSDQSITDENKLARMVLNQPQQVKFEIRGRKGAESGHC